MNPARRSAPGLCDALLDDITTLGNDVVMTLVEPAEALAALDASGLFTPGSCAPAR